MLVVAMTFALRCTPKRSQSETGKILGRLTVPDVDANQLAGRFSAGKLLNLVPSLAVRCALTTARSLGEGRRRTGARQSGANAGSVMIAAAH